MSVLRTMSKSQVQLTVLMLFTEALAGHALGEAEPVVLHGGDGVEATFAVVTAPPSSMTTQSVKVPPMSTPTRYEPILPPGPKAAG